MTTHAIEIDGRQVVWPIDTVRTISADQSVVTWQDGLDIYHHLAACCAGKRDVQIHSLSGPGRTFIARVLRLEYGADKRCEATLCITSVR